MEIAYFEAQQNTPFLNKRRYLFSWKQLYQTQDISYVRRLFPYF